MIRRLIARFRIARRLSGGSFVMKSPAGKLMARGKLKTTPFRVFAEPCRIHKPGMVSRIEILLEDGSPGILYRPKPFKITRRDTFAGKEITLV